MKFADDITLGDFTCVDLDDLVGKDDYSGRGQRAAKWSSGFQLSFVVSAILHFGLASTFFYFVASDIATIEEFVHASIKLEFIPFNPLLNQAEESISETPSENTVPRSLAESSPTLSVAESQLESNQADFPEIGESEIAEVAPVESSVVNSLPLLEAVTLPSVESVQLVLSNLQRSDASSFYTYDCNNLEKRADLAIAPQVIPETTPC